MSSAQGDTKAGPPSGPDTAWESSPVGRFVLRLSREERMLIVLKSELYEGLWDDMVADLQARLAGRPYIFKLASRIQDDLQRIGRLREFEVRQQVNLSDYVKMD